jgi:Response regulators consisting of a CheY-like receiver domain and a winged-helix DNA-binding domain
MRILLVEDDKALTTALQYRFCKEGLELLVEYDGAEALDTLKSYSFDMVIMDRMLPSLDGITLLKKIRALNIATPVLMLTAMDGIADRVLGLDAGADDYLVKPFSVDELLARVRALARRKEAWHNQTVLQAGDLQLNAEQLLLITKEGSTGLSKREGALMEMLMLNFEKTLPRALIIDRVWRDSDVEDGSLDIYIHFLRKHLAALHSRTRIETLRGVGYRLVKG